MGWPRAWVCWPSADCCLEWAKAADFPQPRASLLNGFRSTSAPPPWASSMPGHHGGVVAPPLLALVVTNADWRAVFYLTAVIGLAWACWWWLEYQPPERHPRLGSKERFLLAPVIGAGQSLEPTPRWFSLLGLRQTGTRRCQVPERRCVVLLPVLAAKVPLRCTRIRHRSCRGIRMDSVRRRRRRLSRGRIAFELAVDPSLPARSRSQNCPGIERGRHACRVARAHGASLGPWPSSASPISGSNPGRRS